jgi:mono/diheme cytochrome c family protein
LRGKLVFGDITTGRVWYAERKDVLAADDADPATLAPIHELDTGLRALVIDAYRARGGKGTELPGAAQISGRGRVDLRFAEDDAGELYVLTKADGMIRKVVGAEVKAAAAVPASAPPPSPPNVRSGPDLTRLQAAALKNPVRATPASIAAGKALYDATCAACHGDRAQGAVKAKLAISIIEEHGGKQPPDLTDDQWDHGSTDGEIYAVTTRGLASTMMPGFDGVMSDDDVWNIVNYLRTLQPKK